jgi:capsule polysaccharide export protein KpsE/RkpR
MNNPDVDALKQRIEELERELAGQKQLAQTLGEEKERDPDARGRILVMDDEEGVREVLAKMIAHI